MITRSSGPRCRLHKNQKDVESEESDLSDGGKKPKSSGKELGGKKKAAKVRKDNSDDEDDERVQCKGRTQGGKGPRCKNMILKSKGPCCRLHENQVDDVDSEEESEEDEPDPSVQCGGNTKGGTGPRCKNMVPSSKGPNCRLHKKQEGK